MERTQDGVRVEGPYGPGPIAVVPSRRSWWQYGRARYIAVLDTETLMRDNAPPSTILMLQAAWLLGSTMAVSIRHLRRTATALGVIAVANIVSLLGRAADSGPAAYVSLAATFTGCMYLAGAVVERDRDRKWIDEHYGHMRE